MSLEKQVVWSALGGISRCFWVGRLIVSLALCATAMNPVWAEVAEPDPREEDQFDIMNELSHRGLHDLKDETWNAYGQATFINSWKSNFSAKYTNLNGSPNSLLPEQERSFTGSATFFIGLKLWRGAEIYAVPEIISTQALSDLKGLGSVIQNFELQKTGGQQPTTYLSRLFLKQTFGFGGERVQITSDPMQLGTTEDSRRLVLRVGNFSILDFLDKNSFSGDLRRQFNNMAFLSYAAYDFAADARGYTWGLVAELIYDDWSLKFGHTAVPESPNQLPINTQIFKYFGHQFEIEHRHRLWDQPGAVRLLAYRNHEVMGRFDEAIAAYRINPNLNATNCFAFNYGSENVTAPDLCWVRRPNIKMGIGLNLEQQIGEDIGLFFRGMVSDGKTEVYSYTSTDQSISLGALVKGIRWNRPRDTIGIGYGQGWLSSQHVAYLGMGGIDGFIGDGAINYRPEKVVDLFYSFNVFSSTWLTADYQHIENPGYNADRGPVDIYAARVHVDF